MNYDNLIDAINSLPTFNTRQIIEFNEIRNQNYKTAKYHILNLSSELESENLAKNLNLTSDDRNTLDSKYALILKTDYFLNILKQVELEDISPLLSTLSFRFNHPAKNKYGSVDTTYLIIDILEKIDSEISKTWLSLKYANVTRPRKNSKQYKDPIWDAACRLSRKDHRDMHFDKLFNNKYPLYLEFLKLNKEIQDAKESKVSRISVIGKLEAIIKKL